MTRTLVKFLMISSPHLQCTRTTIIMHTYIKTHGSESRGQEEAGLRDEPVSYLQVAPL